MSKKTPLRLERLVKAAQFTSEKKLTLADIADAIRYSRDHFTAIYKFESGDHLYDDVLSVYKASILKGLAKAYYLYSAEEINSNRLDRNPAHAGAQKSVDPKVIFEAAQKLALKLNPGQDATKDMQVAYQKLLKQLEMGIGP